MNVLRQFFHRQPCALTENPADPEEVAAARKEWREAIHKNRNISTASTKIARDAERASTAALDAANEAIAEIQKSRERIAR